ncbi:hypothetical protein IC229_04305 [Spirosoma sp. BT702]|uniref:Uncharacterized protein n=1 Tax=Spirosoma profusum TaxID=2771354 RepID=A0A926Y0S3_9BACT|nr:hypothetical protein [Spirosoma profusum]MBD2699845.1 hypothetical protein [Spirosoma profusum]
MDFKEMETDEVVILNDITMKLNSFFVFALEWIFPLRELFNVRPEDGKTVLNESFRYLIDSDHYKAIAEFNTIGEEKSGNYDTRTIRTLIAKRYCYFRDFESQQGYTRYLLDLVHGITWRTDLAQSLFKSIEIDGFHQYFENDHLELLIPSGQEEDNERYRVDELVIMLISQTVEMITSEIESLSRRFTPKEYEKWKNAPELYKDTGENAGIEAIIKSERFSLKQQMIALDKLGFKDAAVWQNIGTQKKAKILSQLLGRNEQDIRAILTYWGVKKTEDRYNTSKEDDIKKVDDFLRANLT